MPFTSAVFSRTVIPYHALLGNIKDKTISAIENNPEAFLAIVPVMTLINSDFTVVIVTVGSASGSLKAEPKECLTSKGQVLSKGLRVERIKQMANFDIIANKDCLKSTIVYARFI